MFRVLVFRDVCHMVFSRNRRCDFRKPLDQPRRTGNGEAAALRTWLELGQWETAAMPRDLGRYQLWTRKAGQSN